MINDLILFILFNIIPKDDLNSRNEVKIIMGRHSLQTPTTIIFDQGIQQGIQQGNKDAQKRFVKILMKTQKITAEKAMELLEIPQEDRKNILQNIHK